MEKKNISKLVLLALFGLSVYGCDVTPSTSTNTSSSKNENSTPNSSLISQTSSSTNNSVISSSNTVISSTIESSTVVTISSIEVTGNYKTEYVVGETLDLTNVMLAITYSDNSKETIPVTSEMISSVDMSVEGLKTITVTYEGLTTTFNIIVNAPAVEKIDPEVTISIENGATLVIGVDAAPTVTVTEGLNYVTYYEKDEVKVSDTLPTEPGTYSFIVEVEGNEQYNSVRLWRWFRLEAPSTKETATITFNYNAGDTFVIGEEKPTVTVSEGADYYITYSSEETGYDSPEFPTEAGTYALVVTVEENETYKADKKWLWFRLVAPTTKVDPEIKFSYENGTTFIKGEGAKPEFTVSEGAVYTTHYYCEAKDATFATYEELEAGYAYSLVVTVEENETYKAKSAFAWFHLKAPTTKVDPEVTISIENGATLTIGVDAAPTVTVPEGLNYVTYYEKDEVRVSDTLPTEPGTYSFIVEVEGNDQYNSVRLWRWFYLVENPNAGEATA